MIEEKSLLKSAVPIRVERFPESTRLSRTVSRITARNEYSALNYVRIPNSVPMKLIPSRRHTHTHH